MATGEAVQVGEAVGIIAAQSIGEPGTPVLLTPSLMIRAARLGVIIWFALTRTSPSLFVIVSHAK